MKEFQSLKYSKLKNGCNVLLMPESHHNLVTFQVWYSVGSRLEDDTTRGVSHFIEHLFFKGTENMGPGEIDRRLNEIGAMNNAATSKDYTFYYCTGVSEQFEAMFNIQAEMLTNPAFAPDEINKERDVVLAEIHRANDNPDRIFHYNIMKQAYGEHPYSYPVLGDPEIIRTASPEVIRGYYEKYYNPSNMNILIAGNFSPEKATEMIENSFGTLPGANTNLRQNLQADNHGGTKLIHAKTAKNYSSMTWLGPDGSNPRDLIALDLLSTILTDRASSRWTRLFRHQLDLVEGMSLSTLTSVEQSPVILYAIVKNNEWVQYHDTLQTELDKLRTFYVSREEIHEAKQYMLHDYHYQFLKLSQRANFLGFYSALNQGECISSLEKLVNSITQEDFVRIIEKYFHSNPVQTKMLPESSTEDITPDPEPEHHKPLYTKSEVKDAGTMLEFQSGLKVLCVKSEEPIAACELFAGNLAELATRFPAGTPTLMQRVISKGTTHLDKEQISKIMDNLGARYSTVCRDTLTRKEDYRCSLKAPVENFLQSLDLFCSFFVEASFPDKEIQVQKDSMKLELKSLPDVLSRYCMHNALINYFEDHPYGQSNLSTQSILKNISRKDLEEFYALFYNPKNVMLVIGSSFSPDEIAKQIQSSLNSKMGTLEFSLKENKIPKEFQSKLLGETRTIKCEKQQGYIIPVYPFPGRHNREDYFTAILVNEILGGGMSSRYFRNMRDEKSFGYEIGSTYVAYGNHGLFLSFLGTRPDRLEEASQCFKEEVQALVNNLLSPGELQKAKSLVLSQYEMAGETLGEQIYRLGNHIIKGLPIDSIGEYQKSIKAVTVEQVQKFAARYFNSPCFEQRVSPS